MAKTGLLRAAAPVAPPTAAGDRRQALVTQVLSAVRRRKWIILGAVLGCLIAGLILTLLITPQYTATSTLEIRRESENITNVAGVEPKSGYADQEFYQTQYGLLRSTTLADRVATELRLYDNAKFFEMFGGGEGWFVDGRVKAGASTRGARVRAAGEMLLQHFVVAPQRLSRLVQISFTSPDPGLSKQITDKWAQAFIQVTLERRYGATAYARTFLEQRLAQLRQRIDQSERRLVDYAGQQGIVNLPSETSGPQAVERSLVGEDLGALNKALGEATADRVAAQSRAASPVGAVTEALTNSAITSLRQTRGEKAADYARLMVQFERDYPPAKALESEIAQLTSRSRARNNG